MANMNIRPYVQRQRAASAAETGTRILAAAIELFVEVGAEPTLDAVATRAGVTVQTVLRRYGSKEGLHLAAVADVRARVAESRGAAPVGDIAGAVANLAQHYAEWGDIVLRLLAKESAGPAIGSATQEGRAFHHAWVERVFAPQLEVVEPSSRPRRLAQLVVITDIYAWKVLHRDLGLPNAEVEATLVDLIARLLA